LAAIRTTRVTTIASASAIPTQGFHVQPLRRLIPLELSISDLLRSFRVPCGLTLFATREHPALLPDGWVMNVTPDEASHVRAGDE
jgi:hypothetical protein